MAGKGQRYRRFHRQDVTHRRHSALQSRAMSLVEAVANVVVAYGVAVATQMIVFPVVGLHATLDQSLGIGLIFTVVSLVRSYALRRIFQFLCFRSQLISDQTSDVGLTYDPRLSASFRAAQRAALSAKCGVSSSMCASVQY